MEIHIDITAGQAIADLPRIPSLMIGSNVILPQWVYTADIDHIHKLTIYRTPDKLMACEYYEAGRKISGILRHRNDLTLEYTRAKSTVQRKQGQGQGK